MSVAASRAAQDDPASLLARAAAAEKAGDMARALQIGRHAAQAYPKLPAAWLLLGVAEYRSGDAATGLRHLMRARELAPEDAEINHTLGLIAYARNDWVLAIDALSRLQANADSIAPAARAEALSLLANLLADSGDLTAAEASARMALALDPATISGRVALAGALYNTGRRAEAVDLLRDVLERDPTNITALLIAAASCESIRDTESAQRFYGRILAIDPEHARALSRQLDVSLTLCDWSHYDALVAQVLSRVRRDITGGVAHSFDVFNLLPLPVDPPLLLAASRVAAAKHARGATLLPPLPRPGMADADRRIRVGYLLPYTERHSLPQALAGVIERHDRSRFDVLGYTRRACDNSAFSRAFRASFDRMTDLGTGRPDRGAERIHADAVDILIDTTGHTGINCLDILAHRPARLQAHYLGYGLTSGADFVDYLITDRNFLGPDGERHISEAPVFLPHSFMATMRAPIAVEGPSRKDEGLPDNGVVFANFNHPCKIDPATFALWLDLLKAVPGSVLWLGDWATGTRQRLRTVAAERGVSPKRLVFAALAAHPVHLRRLALADIALDNRLYGGGVTTLDALWAGLPVVSLAGVAPASRLGATLLAAAGVPELVTDSVEAYIALTLGLARDPARRAALRETLLANRATEPLFDVARQTRALEAAYRAMWSRLCAGEMPAPIAVPEQA
jgi:predicted O-linked N-acetylglucosamine transferase (SPINDLY family)